MQYITLFLLLIVSGNTWAQRVQDTIPRSEHQVAMIARATKEGTILLRWATTTPVAWRKANAYGYRLARFTIIRDGKTLDKPVYLELADIKPDPEESWYDLATNNDNAAIMAQALYGEDFDISGQDKLSAIVNLANEQEQRFTWGLYAAEQDFDVAVKAGLGYRDTQALANEKYVYKIISLAPKDIINIEEGGVFIGLKDYEPLPKPMDITAFFTDANALLSWNYAVHKATYNSYYIERSEDGTNFKRLNDLPYSTLNNKPNVKRMFYIDSIPNGKTYYYRVKGVTPFGELSTASDVVSGKGHKVLKFEPHISSKNYIDDKRVKLFWTFPEAGKKEIKGFELERSDTSTGVYKVVLKNIAPELREIQYDSMQVSNYFKITAVAKNGARKSSLAEFVQPVDSIPPAKPEGLIGKVDSLGIVTLTWDANKEEDMLGYRVYRGFTANEEFSQLTVAPHRATVYYDSIGVHNLNAKVYYQIIAVDKRYNGSKPSDVAALLKPDFIPPTQPIFQSYKIKDGKIILTWVNSSSEDVVRHVILRKAGASPNWEVVFTKVNGEEAMVQGQRLKVKDKSDADLEKRRKRKEERKKREKVKGRGLKVKSESNTQHQASSTQYPIPNTSNLKPNTQYPTTANSWEDKDIIEGGRYSYQIVAYDTSELRSLPMKSLTLTVPKTSMKPAIKRFANYVNREQGYIELFWKKYEEKDVAELALYKSVKGKPISLYRNLSPNTVHLIDNKLHPNNDYVYILRAVFKDGTLSKTTKLIIKY